MLRISVFLMVILLLFSTTPVSFAQLDTVQAQAEADANSDMSDGAKAMLFLLGGLGSTAGCLIGCVGGCMLGTRLGTHANGEYDVLFSPSEVGCAVASAILLGAFAMPLGVDLYPHNVTPPPERLLGKSPEYVEAYTQIYTSKITSLRKRLVIAGSITGNVGVALAMLLAYTSAYR